jgi:hypothetical protein
MPRCVDQRTFREGLHIPVANGGAAVCASVVERNAEEGVAWVHSCVSADEQTSLCVYDAPSPEAVRKTGMCNQLPVDEITEVRVFDPHFYASTKGGSTMCKFVKHLVMVATVLAAAIIPAAASARPVRPDIAPFSVSPPPVQHAPAAQAPGFSWHDAGVGAAGMLVLIGLGSGAVLAVRRRAVLS